jgi:ABC-type lipoprotein export system ATPase subunit
VNNTLPKDRDVATVFQNHALYPHMSVEKNIGFALKIRGDSKAAVSRGERLRQDLARRAALVAKMGPRVKVIAGDILSVQISPEHAHFFDVATGRTLRRS